MENVVAGFNSVLVRVLELRSGGMKMKNEAQGKRKKGRIKKGIARARKRRKKVVV
jgi:hypothetical protein